MASLEDQAESKRAVSGIIAFFQRTVAYPLWKRAPLNIYLPPLMYLLTDFFATGARMHSQAQKPAPV